MYLFENGEKQLPPWSRRSRSKSRWSAPPMRCQLEPKRAAMIVGTIARYNPYSGGMPAMVRDRHTLRQHDQRVQRSSLNAPDSVECRPHRMRRCTAGPLLKIKALP